MTHQQPTSQLDQARYGKDGIRALMSMPGPEGVDLVRDISFSVRVEGPFEASYRQGNNSEVVPSDSLRRHMLQVAAARPDASPEVMCAAGAEQIRDANRGLTAVEVEASERMWEPLAPHTSLASSPNRFASTRISSGAPPALLGGVDDLRILATRGSAFTGFRRDRLTVQAEAHDRPLCGALCARWLWSAGHQPTLRRSRALAMVLTQTLADRPSNAIQELLGVAGTEFLERVPEVAELRLRFAALPLISVPAELVTARSGAVDTRAHEVGGGPLGVTEATLRRSDREVPCNSVFSASDETADLGPPTARNRS